MVRGIGLVKDLKDIARVVVKSVNGTAIYLEDIGSVRYGNLERKGALGYSDKRGADYADGIEGIVLLLKHQNPSQVLQGIQQAVDELNSTGLPKVFVYILFSIVQIWSILHFLPSLIR